MSVFDNSEMNEISKISKVGYFKRSGKKKKNNKDKDKSVFNDEGDWLFDDSLMIDLSEAKDNDFEKLQEQSNTTGRAFKRLFKTE